mgnify:FL=1
MIIWPPAVIWYLHERAAPFLLSDERQEAAEITAELERAIILCEDGRQSDAAVAFRQPCLLFLIGRCSIEDKDSYGKPVGREALAALIRARGEAESEYGPVAQAGDRSYEEARYAHDDDAGTDAGTPA